MFLPEAIISDKALFATSSWESISVKTLSNANILGAATPTFLSSNVTWFCSMAPEDPFLKWKRGFTYLLSSGLRPIGVYVGISVDLGVGIGVSKIFCYQWSVV